MARLLILAVSIALTAAAPSGPYHGAGYGGVAHALVGEHVYAGPPVAETRVRHGVVGHRTVQVGTKTVQTGHQYVQREQSVHQPPAYSVVESPAQDSEYTVPIASPVLPAPAPPPAIPPAPVNLGPSPPDVVTQEKILAPVRTHTRITPRITRIEPSLQVNHVPVEVPKPVPVPVERTVVHTRKVPQPYLVEVPRPFPVPQFVEVRPVHTVVDSPIIVEKSYYHQQPVVGHHANAAPVGYASAPVAPVGVYGGNTVLRGAAAPVPAAH